MSLWWLMTGRTARRIIERTEPCAEPHCLYCCTCPPCLHDRARVVR